jgi:hypothetical protein
MILSLVPLLNNCSRFPVIKTVELGAINFKGGYCRTALFDFNYGKLQAVSESKNRPLEYCHKFIGISPDGWGDIINYLDSIYVWKDKNIKLIKKDKRSIAKKLNRKKKKNSTEDVLKLND